MGYHTIIGDADLPSLGAGWHTIRLEVRGQSLRFIVDNRLLVRGLDRHLMSGTVDISGQDVPLMIRNFTMVSL